MILAIHFLKVKLSFSVNFNNKNFNMKAAVLESYNNFVWKDVPTPKVKSGEVLVRISFASICGPICIYFLAIFTHVHQYLLLPVMRWGGVVQEIGEGVNGFSGGDKVAIAPVVWCNNCPACKRGHFPANLKLLGIDLDGGFAELISVPPFMLFKAEQHIPDEHVALVEIYAIGFHANNRAGTKQGDVLVIWGAGRVGQVILQAARSITDETIFMVDPLENRLKITTSFYENVVPINPKKENPVEVIKAFTKRKGVDIAFEAVGHAEEIEGVYNPIRSCIQSLRGGGKVCVLGLSDHPAPVVFKELIWKEAQIITSRVNQGEFAEVIDNLNLGNLKPEALISKVMRGSQTQEAFELVQKHKEKYLKVLLDFS